MADMRYPAFWRRAAQRRVALPCPPRAAEPAAPRMVRVPFSSAFVPCYCGALDKDDCACIRVAMRSNTASASSGVVDA